MQNYKIPRTGGNPDDLGFGDEFLDTTPKARLMKEKISLISLK